MTLLKLYSGCALALSLTGATLPARAVVFNLIPEAGTPQYALDALTTAANRWSAVLTDNITVNVQVGFQSLGPGIIGQTGSDFREYSYLDTLNALAARRTSPDDFSAYAALPPGPSYTRLINRTSDHPNGPDSAIPYLVTMDRVGFTTANAKVLGLLEASTSLDATIRFNSDFNFDFNPTDGINFGHFDFVGVAMHELGHALGFVSGVDDLDQYAGLLRAGDFSSNLLDLFRFSTESIAFGLGVSDYTADARAKYFSVDGGLTEVARFATGLTYGDGRQASHWTDFLELGLMNPSLATGTTMELSVTDLRAFDVLGYTVLIPEPVTGTLLLLGGMLFLGRRKPKFPPAQTPS
jgi:hypothetical protein